MTQSDGFWLVLLVFGVSLVMYLLPGIIATNRKHHQKVAIWVLTVLGGWTGIGWVGAMVWAFTNPSPSSQATVQQTSRETATQAPPVDAAAEIERFAKLRADGLLTEEEFAAKKKALLGLGS